MNDRTNMIGQRKLPSRRTSRSRTTFEGRIKQVSSRWRKRVFRSRCYRDRRSNHINSVFFVFSFKRIDAHQDWISWKQAMSIVFEFSVLVVDRLYIVGSVIIVPG